MRKSELSNKENPTDFFAIKNNLYRFKNSPTLTGEEQLAYFSAWRNDGDEYAFNRLFTSFIDLSYFMAYKILSSNNYLKLSADKMVEEVGLQTIVDSLYKFDPTHESSAKISTYVSAALFRNYCTWLKNYQKEARTMVDPEIVVVGSSGEDETLDLFNFFQTSDDCEGEVIAEDLRSILHGVVMAITAVQSTNERALKIMELRNPLHGGEHDMISFREVAEQMLSQVSRQRIALIEGGLTERIREVLIANLDTESANVEETASSFLLGVFFPQMDKKEFLKENLEKLTTAGVNLRRDGKVDLSRANNNLFNIASFRCNDGRFISGYKVLEESGTETIVEFFKRAKINQAAVLYPEKTNTNKNSPVTREDILNSARSAENIRKMMELFKLKMGPSGKWIVYPRNNLFVREWFNVKGKRRGGRSLLTTLYGLDNVKTFQGGFEGKEGKIKFFNDVFGKDCIEISFWEENREGFNSIEMDVLLAELEKPENLETMRSLCEESEDGRLILNRTHKIGRPSIQKYFGSMVLQINGKPMGIKAIIRNLGMDQDLVDKGAKYLRWESLLRFFKIVFGEEGVITRREYDSILAREYFSDSILHDLGVGHFGNKYIITPGTATRFKKSKFKIGEEEYPWYKLVLRVAGTDVAYSGSIQEQLQVVLGTEEVYYEGAI